jgi:hypothetical protein
MNKKLKEQIEKTIEVYTEACKKENLNIKYCYDKNLEKGICSYCIYNDFSELLTLLDNKTDKYLFNTPVSIDFKLLTLDLYSDIKIKNPTILKCHKARIKFLKQLLKDE